jgi:predicted ATPase/transcriptional regulator with XRE-family HTH domain
VWVDERPERFWYAEGQSGAGSEAAGAAIAQPARGGRLASGASSPFGDLLKRYRATAGLTQDELAERARLSARTISDLERGVKHRPHTYTVQRLVRALDLAAEEQACLEVAGRSPGLPSLTEEGWDACVDPAGQQERRTGGPPLTPTTLPAQPTAAAGGAATESTGYPDLPTPLTPLIGRDGDVARATALLREGARLLTLTGPGGVGKTRLGLQVAAEARALFADGVAFVTLAPLADAGLVLPTVAQALGLRASGGRPLGEMLQRALRGRRLLLVLDNCEHVLAGASAVAALLEGCPQLVVLATSRAPLRVRGEHEYPVAPLALPAFDRMLSMDEAAESPAVRLFVDRAQAASPGFMLAAANASTVAAICGRLDGLPLALELAAPRVKLLPPSALLARLHRVLPLLTGGRRDAPARQQTLRATIDWSYGLLTAAEQTLLARLAVFAGGCTLEAIEAITGMSDECMSSSSRGGPADGMPYAVLDLLVSLVDASLLQAQCSPAVSSGSQPSALTPRFVMLETIREYAWERLEAHRETARLQQAHAAYYLALAEQAEPALEGPEQAIWLARLEREHDNFRAALSWALQNDAAMGVRLAGALWQFWLERGSNGYYAEGRQWLMEALAAGHSASAAERARALYGAAGLAFAQGDVAQAMTLAADSLALAQKAGDTRLIILALRDVGARSYELGQRAQGKALLQESLALARQTLDTWLPAIVLANLGAMALNEGEAALARTFLEESLALGRAAGDTLWIGFVLGLLGRALTLQGAYAAARPLLDESLAIRWEGGNTAHIAACLEGLAGLVAREGRPEGGARAARLLGAAEGLRATAGAPIPPMERRFYDDTIAAARTHLDAAAFATVWAAGRALTPEQALAEVDSTVAPLPG